MCQGFGSRLIGAAWIGKSQMPKFPEKRAFPREGSDSPENVSWIPKRNRRRMHNRSNGMDNLDDAALLRLPQELNLIPVSLNAR